MKKFTLFAFLFFAASVLAAFAQPRPPEKPMANPAVTTPEQLSTAKAAPAPESFSVKYEGGIFGFSEKMDGTLKFDDINERLIFSGKDQKEKFSIPYKSLLIIYPETQSVRSNTATAVSVIPLPGAGLASLIKKKQRYLVVNFDDPNVDAKGLANFRLGSRELLDSVLQTLGNKAKLTQRGEAFYRPRASTQSL